MNEQKEHDELSSWYSSYGLITAERILEKYHMRLTQDVLIRAFKNPHSIYYRLLRVPIKNVLNGIILTQAKDYQTYVQKLFIDYLLSGEDGKDNNTPGASTREELEEKRQELTALGERFQQLEREHSQLISESQAQLISFSVKWKALMNKAVQSCEKMMKEEGKNVPESAIEHAITYALANITEQDASGLNKNSDFIQNFTENLGLVNHHLDLDKLSTIFQDFFSAFKSMEENLEVYIDKIKSMAEQLREYRSEFYEKIIQVNELLYNLSDYRMNDEQIKINKEALNFDRDII
ncbi:hypothetical protein E3983_07725 [Legionella israelensis]|uniref:Uncharacterized protein n=1 Tax=Legionella israelensis TaxID=454 RepID=A0AAX1EGL7_9GAMM|nr:hypothetical protein [Legionella israelensis]QBR84260.1 hypothetical protein E3983_07725 [Legionella israelensis]